MSFANLRGLGAFLLFALAPVVAQAGQDFYRGHATTQSVRGQFQDPVVIRVNGSTLRGNYYSNTFNEIFALRGKVGVLGHFRIKISTPSGITGAIAGKVRHGGIAASGRLVGDRRGAATLRFVVKRSAPRAPGNGWPDLSGTRRLYLQHYGTSESYKSINFTLQKEANDYSYRAVFADAPSRTDKVDARVNFPTGDALKFSNDFTYHYAFIPVTIDFDVRVAPERSRGEGVYSFSFMLHYTDSANHGIAFGYYQGYYDVP